MAAGPSYASAAAAPATTTATPVVMGQRSTIRPTPTNLLQLATPPPKSMTLAATLQLLSSPLLSLNHQNAGVSSSSSSSRRKEFVYLMTTWYLENWLAWAAHQTVPPEETERLEQAIRMATAAYGFHQHSAAQEYDNPGPIDATELSESTKHPRRLKPHVIVQHPVPLLVVENNNNNYAGSNGESTKKSHPCCAVPENFYETLRSVHGVLCEDGISTSFQPFDDDYPILMYRYSEQQPKVETRAESNGHHHASSNVDGEPARPIEFLRKVVYQQSPLVVSPNLPHYPKSPISKLIQQEHLCKASLVPSVEVYPRKITFTVTNGTIATTTVKDTILKPNFSKSTTEPRTVSMDPSGYVLVSQDAPVLDTLQAIMKSAAPSRSSTCVRVWSKRGHTTRRGVGDDKKIVGATTEGDDFELVHLDALDGSLIKDSKVNGGKLPSKQPPKPMVLVHEWMARQVGLANSRESVEILVETKSNNEALWPRSHLELGNRIQVGDFVDAQDATGQWYEAVVREVNEETVIVHYFGWASKWDSRIRRYASGPAPESVKSSIRSPMPLWAHSRRWRESLQVGQYVEVRDSTSRADRPKWYKGIIKAISKQTDPVNEIVGGADLETYFVENGNGVKRPLLLLNRTRQALVDVPQERNFKSRPNSVKSAISGNGITAQPPFLRWVNIYGEEICAEGTHLEVQNDSDRPAILAYEVGGDRAPVEVFKPYGSTLGAGFIRESLRGVPPAPGSVGLQNLGNSCFLNSVVQCLNHIEPLTKYFLSDAYVSELNRSNPLGSGGSVAVAYASLVRDMWSGEYSILAPRLLKQTVANFAPQFNNSYQHDSHEFCSFLMDGLHEDLNRVKSKPYVEELEGLGMNDDKIAIESWRKHLLRHDSVIVDHCQGMHRSHLTCPGCGKESLKFDVFSSISLPLAPTKDRSAVPLTECIEQFMEGEQLDEANAWYCPSCKKHVCALKMIALWSVPDILILQLKRFTFIATKDSSKVLRSKIDCLVQFPLDKLDLRKYILGPIDENAPPVYKLFGVSEHSGATANSGHYTATVRNSQDGQWYRYNDSHVGETSGDASVTGGAYLLFYQRSKGSLRWGGLEKVMMDRAINPYGGLETDQDGFTQVKTKKKKKGKA